MNFVPTCSTATHAAPAAAVLPWRAVAGLGALRRRAVRDAVAAAFVTGLQRTLGSALAVAVLLGVILLREVLPLVPWFGRNPSDLSAMFLFAVQHLGDIVAGILVVGQAGLVVTWELEQVWAKHRDAGARAVGIDPVEYFVLPRVWALAALYVFTLLVFKVVAVTAGALVAWGLDGHFYGAEIGDVLVGRGPTVLLGYAVNIVLALLLAAVCCAPPVVRTGAPAPALPTVFRRALVLIFAAKLVTLVI